MGLSVRKEKILKAVVDDYIASATPISSNEIRERHLPSLSAATIRNELAALEEMGYLIQPHTSAGRIPTALAYKLYVDKLMPKRKLNTSELKIIKKYFNKQVVEVEDLLKRTAKVISEVTNLTGVAFSGNPKDAIIESIKIVKLSHDTALVVIVTDKGILKDTTVRVDEDLSSQYYEAASDLITQSFSGHTIAEMSHPSGIIGEVKNEYRVFFDTVLKIIAAYSDGTAVDELVLEGASKILEQPEYSNLHKARAMLAILDAKDKLVPFLQSSGDMSLNVQIGRDAGGGDADCAIVTASYSVGGKPLGNAGVIGPMRMDYSKVISVLSYIGKTLNMLPQGESDEGANGLAEEEGAEDPLNGSDVGIDDDAKA